MRNILLLFCLFNYLPGLACTTVLIGSQCTLDGSTILAHNEDMGYKAVGKLWHVDSEIYEVPQSINVKYIPYELKQTYAYWASGNAKAGIGLGKAETSSYYDNILVGMNEHGLAMACNWMNSKEEAIEGKGINRYALRQLILETSKNAREAVEFIGFMIETYGQADWGGLTYCLADKKEAWIVETTASQWVARKILKNEIHTVANQYTIGEHFDLHSEKLYQFAIQKGWYDKNTTFNFREVYGKPGFLDNHYDARRSTRVDELLSHKKGIITIQDVMDVLRDRYDDTEDFSLPVIEECWREWCMEKDIRRPISTNITQSSSIAYLRNGVEDSFSSVMWYACATPNFNGYFPIYAKSKLVPEIYSKEGLREDNAWQYSKKLQVEGDKNYHENSVLAQSFWKVFENEIHAKMELLEKQIRLTGRPELIDKFTYTTASDLLRKQASLLKAFSEN